ncbi:hypothetical protein KTI62_00235 [Acinetobacter schindleri]|uniref:hypothetical protein n=1 Tax=Acinetobacter schindleri TaxID=108981 RepID=UPI0021CD7B68|nr:hypothetical protein [Acinetobacter schindleri]MCU4518628.1 hypothetical protein [Acinetobacter schindleri]
MPTQKVKLTTTPQKIATANLPAYIQSHHNRFRFAFGPNQPTDLEASHQDMQVYSDGSLGDLWVWVSYPSNNDTIIVST